MTYVFLLDLGLGASTRIGSERTLMRHIVLRTSSSGVKSLTMLKSFLISSGVLPLIILATDLHPTSLGIDCQNTGDLTTFEGMTHSNGLISR